MSGISATEVMDLQEKAEKFIERAEVFLQISWPENQLSG
jgi:hypothetical protein